MEFKSLYGTVALTDFPHFVINREITSGSTKYFESLRKILMYYYDYKKGADFQAEGSGGDYVPSNLKFKQIKGLIDKEARFMFSHMPDVNIICDDASEEEKAGTYNMLIQRIIERNNFSGNLLKAAKDCFIGCRVALVVDYSERTGIGMSFYDSLSFYYETEYGSKELTKMVTFEDVSQCKNTTKKEWLVNRYERTGNTVKMSSIVYDAGGKAIQTLLSERVLPIEYIPAVVILNEGLVSDKSGVSDVEDLESYEKTYSFLGNADIDSERKNMNPIYILVDMNHETTRDLSTSAGSVWDMETSATVDDKKPEQKILTPDMKHVDAVKTTLDRIKSTMYGEFDIPDITVEGTLSGITSYKAIRALYFPLTVRCDEKLNAWKESLQKAFKMAIEIALINDTKTREIYEIEDFPELKYRISVVENYALLADENEEKALDLDEVNAMSRSRYSYLKKWRGEELKTDEDIENEIMRIAREQNMLDSLSMGDTIKEGLEEEKNKEELETKIDEGMEGLTE